MNVEQGRTVEDQDLFEDFNIWFKQILWLK